MLKTIQYRLLAGFLSVGMPIGAYANICVGKISYVNLEAEDYVKIDIGFGMWTTCRLNNSYPATNSVYGTYTITPAVCQSLLANFITAKTMQSEVNAYIVGTCPGTSNLSANYPYAWIFK